MTYDFDFLTDSQEANKQAILLAKIRYNEQLAPFVSSPNAKDQEARLRYASDHIERIIDECCEVTNADREVVSGRLKQIIAKEVATTSPQKRNVTEQVDGDSSPGGNGDNQVGNAVQQDILDRDAVLESEILDPDAQIEADTPLSEGEVQYPKAAARKTADWDTDEVINTIDNDEGLYNHVQEIASQVANPVQLEQELEEIWDRSAPAYATVDSTAVDWNEVAEHFMQDRYSKTACVRCGDECEGPVCTECGNFLAKRADAYAPQPGMGGIAPQYNTPGVVQNVPTQQPQNNQQMKCDVCGFVGNAQQVQDHYQKMVAANDQLHMNNQPAGNPNVQPGQVQAKTAGPLQGVKNYMNRIRLQCPSCHSLLVREGNEVFCPDDGFRMPWDEVKQKTIPYGEALKWKGPAPRKGPGVSLAAVEPGDYGYEAPDGRGDESLDACPDCGRDSLMWDSKGNASCPYCGMQTNAYGAGHFKDDPEGYENWIREGLGSVTAKYQYIERRGDAWVILQKTTGKVLSHHDSYEKAVAAFKAMMANKHGAAEDFLDQQHNHDQEDRAEGDPVHEDHQEEESKDPTDRLDEVVQEFADHAAAKRYSQADDDEVQQIADRYGLSPEDVKNHLHVIALFGDYTGLNGDIVNSDPSTEGLTEINDADLGGQGEPHEALVPMDKAVEKVAEGLGMQLQDAYDRLQEGFGGEELPDEYHASVEGQRNFYLPNDLVSGGTDEGADQAQSQQPQQNTGQPTQ